MSAHGDRLEWVRAEDCDSSGYVEVAVGDGVVFVRNSRDPDCARLSFTRQEWLEFVDRVRAGRFVVD